MLKPYGYLGLVLILLAEINFSLKVMPFASWYIVIVWYGFILFVDSLVYRIRGRSLISTYPKEFLLMILVSLPFWLIFELYNLFTLSWYYLNYVWYVHLLDFTTIVPAVLETFSLLNALEIGKKFDRVRKAMHPQGKGKLFGVNAIRLLVVLGAIAAMVPFIAPGLGFMFIWIGLFLFLDPLSYLIGRPSVVEKVGSGTPSVLLRLFLSGIIMGLLWELWNYQAYPKWVYSFPGAASSIKLFAMPLLGYLGYLPFALEAFLFYALLRSFVFRGHNELISI
ncbi:MAG: hypothetical protein KGH61_04400 [Candidatus Micrarchaeota archaeon]|nr:hypothetical protein [Candidatus Micrarchaeota archaeon]MDE1848159.1 hypothetical protein [Candidatus Micrarchaeota archaeon]MDE1864653.1 hypothetical protein [Candidatus Micrarchaeota archaeon]